MARKLITSKDAEQSAPVGRPRKYRSRPTSGIGGRPFTDAEIEALLDIAETYGFDRDADTQPLLMRLSDAYGSYLADVDALGKQVSVADEMRDLETVTADARQVRQLLIDHADESDPSACIGPPARLAVRMQNFPNMLTAETTRTPQGVPFMHAQFRIVQWVVRIRYWPENRSQLLTDIDLILEVCAALPMPPKFTKRHNIARDRFGRALAGIYRDVLHPLRLAAWREVRDAHIAADDQLANEPPLPSSHRAFANGVLRALHVPFESKGTKK